MRTLLVLKNCSNQYEWMVDKKRGDWEILSKSILLICWMIDMANRVRSAGAEDGFGDECEAEVTGSESETSFLFPWLPGGESTSFQNRRRSYTLWAAPPPFGEVKDDGAASGSKSHSHSQAEKRRRDRINAQLATLRKLIPKSDKMDKAALLGSVVEHVKDLKRKALKVSQVLTVPTDVDEVTIHCYSDQDGSGGGGGANRSDEENIFIKASVCCADRPELFSELTHAVRGLKLTTVRADMASLGGRMKSILVLCTKDRRDGACLNGVVQSLKGALSRIAASSSAGLDYHHVRSKRQRFFLPSPLSP
ncbi:hypothetical protein U1Q18_022365 [Sarracenia purpurea var. burkii]